MMKAIQKSSENTNTKTKTMTKTTTKTKTQKKCLKHPPYAIFLISHRALITIHILKAYDESCSKIIRENKYKDKDNDKDKDKDKDTEKVPETPNLCYIFEILMTHSFQI